MDADCVRPCDAQPVRLQFRRTLGEVVYGNIGASERLDFTVVGSAVNEASRIEGMCRPLQNHHTAASSLT
jgi:class 3 adenylate cyclase